MAKYKNNNKGKSGPSPQTVEDAEAMAKATAKPGQSKEQTKLIAQGIQKGIEEYKKRQKGKARELDKKLKKVKQSANEQTDSAETTEQSNAANAGNKLPWVLLGISWVGFIAYIAVTMQ